MATRRSASAEERQGGAAPDAGASPQPVEAMHLAVTVGAAAMSGELTTMAQMKGLVLIAQGDKAGDGDCRHLAELLHRCQLGTLSFELLTAQERAEPSICQDVALQALRIGQVMQWLGGYAQLPCQPYGLMASAVAAAAALEATAALPGRVAAVVTCGGRLDLAWPCLPSIHAPTLMIVGDQDPSLARLHRTALRVLTCAKRLEVIPGAGASEVEPGAYTGTAALAASWMRENLDRHPQW